MLVFDNEETLDATIKMLDKMTSAERKVWEEDLGFKSYDRLIHEIIDAEIVLNEGYGNLPVEKQKKLLKSTHAKQYTSLTREYAEKGVVYFTTDANGSESMNFVYLTFSKIINENGFYKVGKRIMQYTKDKFKAIENGDFEKVGDLLQLNENVENGDFFISDLIITRKEKSVEEGGGGGGHGNPPISYYSYPWSHDARVSTEINRERIYIQEIWSQHSYSTTQFVTDYNLKIQAQRKNIWGNWKPDDTRIWLDGYCWINDGGNNYYITLDINDHNDDHLWRTLYYSILPKGTYPYTTRPQVLPTSYWKASRWGGPSGIWVSLTNHTQKDTN